MSPRRGFSGLQRLCVPQLAVVAPALVHFQKQQQIGESITEISIDGSGSLFPVCQAGLRGPRFVNGPAIRDDFVITSSYIAPL